MGEMIKVTENFGEALGILDQVARKCQERTGLMSQLGGIMQDEIEENFDKQGRPGKWAALAKSTIRRRTKKGHWPGKILQVRGRLATSFQVKADNDNAICGTNVKYAAMQNFGGTTKFGARARVLHFGDQHSAKMGKDRVGPGRATRNFAKPGKATYGMKVAGKAYSITIPARRILYLGPGAERKMYNAALAWITGFKR